MNTFSRVFLAPDGGEGGTTGIDAHIPDQTQGGQAQPQTQGPAQPAWMSQLPKEMREDKALSERLCGHKSLADLANALIRSEDDGRGKIKLPDKDSTDEEVRAFFTALGVPENAADYRLDDYDMDPEAIAKSKELFMAAAHKSMLSTRQAQNIWGHIVAITKAGNELAARQQKKLEDAFEPQYNRLLEAEYPEKAERDKAIRGELEYVKMFMSDLGIAEEMRDSGIVYRPKVMHAIARYVKDNSPAGLVSGAGGVSKDKSIGAFGDSYSDDFRKLMGGKK